MREIGTRAALSAALGDREIEVSEDAQYPIGVRRPTPAPALFGPFGQRPVAAFPVAPPAGRDLVLRPGRAALRARHEMLRGRLDQLREPAAAPHAGRAVPLDRRAQPGG